MKNILGSLALSSLSLSCLIIPYRPVHLIGAASAGYGLVLWRSALESRELEKTKKQIELAGKTAKLEMLAKYQLLSSELELSQVVHQVSSEVGSSGTSQTLPALPSTSGDWVNEAVTYSSVLIFGGMGSGKTTLATEIVRRKQGLGHQIIVLDPHAAKGQWAGLQVVGSGMDYTAIDEQLVRYHRETERRYQLLATEGKEAVNQLPHICILTEEFTNYAARCKQAKDFLQACMSDNRKVNMSVLMISHNNTLPTLGGAKGIAQLRDDALLEIKLIPPSQNLPRRAYLKLPGQQFVEVQLPTIHQELIPTNTDTTIPTSGDIRDSLEQVYKLPSTENYLEPIPEAEGTQFTNLGLSYSEAQRLVFQMQERLPKSEIIRLLWGATKGGSTKYVSAEREYRLITGELISD